MKLKFLILIETMSACLFFLLWVFLKQTLDLGMFYVPREGAERSRKVSLISQS